MSNEPTDTNCARLKALLELRYFRFKLAVWWFELRGGNRKP